MELQKTAPSPSKDIARQTPKIKIDWIVCNVPAYHTVEEFRPVAELITPDPPDWLAEHLCRWSSTIFMSQAVERWQPRRAEMLAKLKRIRGAAAVLRHELGEAAVCEFLNEGGSQPLDSPQKFQMIVGELEIRADRASKLPNLVNKKGRTKAGQGRAQPNGAISTQTYCAMFIAEAWKWFREEYPKHRNRDAAKAIDLYWQLGGGQRNTWGDDPLNGWRPHLKEAAEIPAEQHDRAEIRRHMRINAMYADSLSFEAAMEGGN